MSIWNTYPDTYRNHEVSAIAAAAHAGECCAIAGLSGSGKSNLLAFMAHRLGKNGVLPGVDIPHPVFALVDCNRLANGEPEELFDLIGTALGSSTASPDRYANAADAVRTLLQEASGVCLLLDRFDAFAPGDILALAGRLRALRDSFKYDLTFVIAARRPPEKSSELAELFYSNTIWLGRLAPEDALWSARQFAARKGLQWTDEAFDQVVALSQGYPSFLRAVCEAYAGGCGLSLPDLLAHPIVQKRVEEFWADQPGPGELAACGLTDHPFLTKYAAGLALEASLLAAQLTAKEHLLWQHFQAHPGEVCEKDALIQSVWPEDRIFERGIRDDSLAQLVRRLREKVEADPSNPVHIHTVPGRGYRFIP